MNWSPFDAAELQALWLSLKVSAAALAMTFVPAVALGWILARKRFRGRILVETIVMLPLVVPPVVVGYLLLIFFGRRGFAGRLLKECIDLDVAFTWLGAALAAAVVGFPLFVRSVRIGFSAMDARLEGMARTLGAGRLRTFLAVSLPLCLPAIVSGAVLSFARGFGEFGATIMIAGNIAGRTQTVPLAVYSAMESPGGLDRAWRLVIISIVIAAAAMLVSEWLSMQSRHGQKRVTNSSC
ncbi:MAG: molybdate ABC transporter permease subunit [Planctomycetes bacterium]|nr:molybdate ABC transporter permease subunit [Planctomycetota bacterium]MBI3832890.1 molybdate ABC transporter permease subunit [Planctomycetota bacterium]